MAPGAQVRILAGQLAGWRSSVVLAGLISRRPRVRIPPPQRVPAPCPDGGTRQTRVLQNHVPTRVCRFNSCSGHHRARGTGEVHLPATGSRPLIGEGVHAPQEFESPPLRTSAWPPDHRMIAVATQGRRPVRSRSTVGSGVGERCSPRGSSPLPSARISKGGVRRLAPAAALKAVGSTHPVGVRLPSPPPRFPGRYAKLVRQPPRKRSGAGRRSRAGSIPAPPLSGAATHPMPCGVNGNTTDSGSAVPGSNPGRAARTAHGRPSPP